MKRRRYVIENSYFRKHNVVILRLLLLYAVVPDIFRRFFTKI